MLFGGVAVGGAPVGHDGSIPRERSFMETWTSCDTFVGINALKYKQQC